MSESDFIDLLRSNPNKGYKRLYKFYPAVRKYIKQNSGTALDAQDIFQEGVLLLNARIKDPDFSFTSKPETYFFSICKFLWNNELRKKSSLVNSMTFDKAEFSNFDSSLIDSYEEEEKLKLMERTLNSIGEKCKMILDFFYHKSMSMQEIADEFGFKSIQSAKTQKYKCLEKARSLINKKNQEL